MALTPGTRLGPYEITGTLGAGGMGEVFRARDTRLDRDVAIKVLPPSFAADADRVARFGQEAKALAALNHPNIAQIYGIETVASPGYAADAAAIGTGAAVGSDAGAAARAPHDSAESPNARSAETITALVMELVDGPTLADRIARGPIPADEALGIALQIAEALQAAHARNIIHRDLKPANVKLTPDGVVKLLDFGIAKMPDAAGAASGGRTPTLLTPALTEVGVLLGTAAYMSPEQAKGRPTDQRADIWAFGCVLYEMLTGQSPFGGEDVTTTLARVLERDVNFGALPASVSPAIRHTIALCLRKDPKHRLADIRDVRLGLDEDLAPAGEPHEAGRPARTRLLPIAAALLTGAGLAAVFAWQSWPDPVSIPVIRFATPMAQEIDRFASVSVEIMAVAPDGSRFAYRGEGGIYVRALDELEPRLLAGTGDAFSNLAFSRDSRQIAYFADDNQIKRIAANGGPAIGVSRAGPGEYITGVHWAADGSIFFSATTGLYRVAADGGDPVVVIALEDDGDFLMHPFLLPDGDSLLLAEGRTTFLRDASVFVYSLSSGERTPVLSGGGKASYLPSGHLVFSTEDRIEAVRFDPATLSVTGQPVPMVQDVGEVLGGPGAHFGVSDNGLLVYLTGSGISADRTFVWVDRDGREESIPLTPGAYVYPRVSPDGTKLALDSRDADAFTWVLDLASGANTPLTTNGRTQYVLWSADGQRIAYTNQDRAEVFWLRADNIGEPQSLLAGIGQGSETRAPSPYFFTPDGAGLVFRNQDEPDTKDDIGMISVGDAGSAPVWLLRGPSNERNAALSPDGRWMAYQSDESGRFEVYVRRFPDMDQRVAASNAGGITPVWSPDGTELFYIEPGSPRRMMSVTFDVTENEIRFAQRSEVIPWPYINTANEGRHYDVAPDGRFVALKDAADDDDSPARFVTIYNWGEELARQLSAD